MQAIDLFATGRTRKEVAEALGVDLTTVRSWFKDHVWKSELEERRAEKLQEYQDVFFRMVPMALNVFGRIGNGEHISIAERQSASEILKSAGIIRNLPPPEPELPDETVEICLGGVPMVKPPPKVKP